MTGYRNVLLAALVASSPLGAFATGRGPQANPAWVEAHWRVLHGRPGVSLRGLAVVDARTLWATGSGGTVLRSLDGGASWRDVGPAAARGDELRDVHAFDAETALAMTAGDSSRLYRTSDGGASWTVVHQDDAFFDTIEFAGSRGVLFGDPTDELPYVWSSVDAGASWQRLMGLPAAIAGEAGFAASGSCASVAGAAIRIVTGGTATRCLATTDGGVAWRATQLPLAHGEPSQGAFAVAFRGGHGVAVGGDYREPTRSVGTAAWTDDGGASWHPADALGYRSGVAWLDDQHVLAVGEQGASLSVDRGRTWRPFGDAGFHVVHAAADGSVFAAGGDGRIAMLAPPQPFTVMPLFGSHMVLPPDDTVVLRGTGTPGEQVAVASSWGGAATAHIDAAGRWRCPLATPPRGGTHSITLRAGTETIALDDVLIGDVWLASGQSNMEMTVGFSGGWRQGVLNWEAEVAAADLPELRMFTVEKAASGTPLDVVAGEWQVCSPATASGFSAAAYFCARELLRRGHGPIGVVVSSWGGTVCEAWTSGEALAPFPEFEAALAATRAPVRPWAERALEFWQAVPGWSGAAALATAEDVALPAVWSQDGLGDFDGVAFYRRRVELPAELRGRELALELGAIDDMDTVWCNGVRIGGMEREGAWATPRSYTLPANATAGAVLELVVRVLDTGGEGGFSGTPAAMKLTATESADGAGGAGELSLAGTWQRVKSVAMRELPPWPRDTANEPNRPAVLYNAMIAPLVPFPFRGVLWYQGESNRSRAEQYARLFPAMIRDWRAAFDRRLPFYFVQIAPYDYGDALGAVEVRWAQTKALELADTGMVVTLDIGEEHDIHPRNKQEVGRRLALHALSGCYGEDAVADGPAPVALQRVGQALRVRFDQPIAEVPGADGASGEPLLAGFELAGADGVFAAATARLSNGAVLVESDTVPEPLHVRYAWSPVPPVSLRNLGGLPAGPFRLSLPH